MYLADSVRQKAMRIFTRLTRHIDILLGFNYGRVPPPRKTARSSRLVDHSSFFSCHVRVRNIGRASSSFLKMRRKKSASLSPSDSWVLSPPLCAQDGAETVDHISLGRVSPAASPVSSHAQSSTSSMLPIAPLPPDLSRDGKVCDDAYEMRQVLFLPFFLSFLLPLVNEAF